jgi:hypothetical protein
VFCSFNNNYKFTPQVFRRWMNILQRVPGSVLWLLADNPWAQQNLQREAMAAGVAAERLVFAPRALPPDYLARYAVADLFLDCYPFNAGTTANDALWMGLPVLTCAGQTFASRMAGALLTAAGLPELITDDLDRYEERAVPLAQDPQRCARLREHLLAQRDGDGVTFGDALRRIGYAGSAPVGGRALDAYFEAHIEQGPILEREDKVVGVVTGALGLRWYDCVWTGQDAHAGPTPMEARRDALRGASRMVEAVSALALRHAPDGRATVGYMQVSPNSRNVVPGLVKMTVDMRNPDDSDLAAMDRELRDAAAAIARELRVECDVQQVDHFPASRFDAGCVAAVREAAQALGYPHREMVSGAGHDAIYVARVAPTAMIFVPCKDGISHNEIEDAKPEHLEAGANVLLHAMLARAD